MGGLAPHGQRLLLSEDPRSDTEATKVLDALLLTPIQ